MADINSLKTFDYSTCYIGAKTGKNIDKLKEMISKMDEHTKHTFVDEGYRILTNTNSETLTDMTKDKLKIAKNFLGKDSQTKGMFTKIFLELAADKIVRELVINNIITYIKNKNSKEKNSK